MATNTKFIRSIGNVRLNGHGVDLREMKDGKAVLMHDRHNKISGICKHFGSLEAAEEWMDKVSDEEGGAIRLNAILHELNVDGF